MPEHAAVADRIDARELPRRVAHERSDHRRGSQPHIACRWTVDLERENVVMLIVHVASNLSHLPDYSICSWHRSVDFVHRWIGDPEFLRCTVVAWTGSAADILAGHLL